MSSHFAYYEGFTYDEDSVELHIKAMDKICNSTYRYDVATGGTTTDLQTATYGVQVVLI